MSEYQRFVTYINRYEGNRKINNVGFAKIESKEEQCKLEIHMKGTGYTGVSCPVYLFIREDDRMLGILVGKMQLVNGNGDGCFLVNNKNINQTGYHLKQLGGFLILASEQVMYASLWDDGGIDRTQFKPLEQSEKNSVAKELQQEVRVESKAQSEAVAESEVETEVVIKSEVGSEAVTESAVSEKGRGEDLLHAAEAAVQPQYVQRIPRQEESWEEKWSFILDSYPVMTPFEENTDILCVRIELKDLRLLPRRYWYLGNNSFLLHGFFNYRYLILGAMEQDGKKRWFLGVPGVFQSQEKVMASIFGFPEYGSEKIAEQKTGQFGYWYRFLNE